MHVNQDEADGISFQEELPLFSTVKDEDDFFLCRTVDEKKIYETARKTQEDWREWQAQYFSSCLLMPRFKVFETIQGKNLLNSSHLQDVGEELGVSRRNLIHRLKDLSLLREVDGFLCLSNDCENKAPLLEYLH